MHTQINRSPLFKVILLSGPYGYRQYVYQFTAHRVQVGRSDVKDSSDIPILALDFDLNVSRRHAQIWSKHDTWFIEDLGSKHGTFVDREDIKGQGAKVLRPGAIVLTGKTRWTCIPNNWLHIYADNVLIYGPFVNSISYALYHCRIPLLGPLFARNTSENQSTSRSLKLEIGDGVFKQSDPYTIEIPALNPGQYVVLDTQGIVLRKGVLSPKSEPTYTHVMLRTTDTFRGIVEKTLAVTVLGYWSWSYDKVALRTIAAFISSENSIVRRIVSEAQRTIKGEDGVRSFQDLIISRSYDKPEQMIMEAIYAYFKDHCDIQWHPPKSEGFFQKIKPPHHIFSSILPRLEGEGTCIDLALLLAGCLENAKLYPIILLTGDEHKQPNHALTGCWVGGWGGRSVIEDKEFLQQEIKAGNILAVETTGFATSTPSNSMKLSFQQAMISAKEHITGASWVYALDIGSLRPQVYTGLDGDTSLNPGITPLETAAESTVYKAQELAKEFARAKKRKAIEITFLFYGCMAAKGDTMRWLLEEQMHLNMAHLCNYIHTLIYEDHYSGEPYPTHNYLLCWRLIEEIAQKSGSPSLREQDLIWAILLQGPQSDTFSAICQNIHIDLLNMKLFMNNRFPLSEIPPQFESMPPTVG